MKINRLLSLITVAFLSIVSANAVKITFGPYLQQVGETEAVIVWGTDVRSVSWVETAPDDNLHFYAEERPKYYQTHLGRKVIDTLHRVKIYGLTPGTTYRYRVFAQEVTEEHSHQVSYGSVASTRVYKKEPLRFTTVDPSKPALDFVIVNDMHADTAKMAGLLKDVKRGETDFVLFNGDMVSHMDTEQQVMDGFVNKAVEMFASEVPFYMVRGNHEGRGVHASRYPDYFPTATGMPYYAFRYGPVFFVMMDGGEDKPDNDIEYFGLNQMDRYREEEAEWLKKVVASEEYRTAPYKVVVVHVPPFGDTWHGQLHSQRLFMPILNAADVDVMLCGHLHRHLFVPAGGDSGASFPVIVNSNVDVVKVHADEKSLEISVRNARGGEILHQTFRP